MSYVTPRTCSMGSSNAGLVDTIGITLLNSDGTEHTPRATAGIYEIGGGCYGKDVTFPDDWEGIIVWDTGGESPVYAVETYIIDAKVDAMDSNVVLLTKHILNRIVFTGGTMTLYNDDGITPLKTWTLTQGALTVDGPYNRGAAT